MMSTLVSKQSLKRVTKLLTYLTWSFVFLYPILTTPIVADDFIGPFDQYSAGATNIPKSLFYGWDAATGGVNFRLIGMPVGSVFQFTYLWLASELHVPFGVTYAMTKFVVFVIVAFLSSRILIRLLAKLNLELGSFAAAYTVGLVLFGTLQIHGLWSNDPVSSYPLAGYGSMIFVLLMFLSAFRFLDADNKAKPCLQLTLISVSALFYYEISIAASAAISLIVFISFLREKKERGLSVSSLAIHAAPLTMPLITIVMGRFLIATSSSNYGGTTINVGWSAIRTFLIGVISSVPGSSWLTSHDLVPEVGRVVRWTLPVLVVIALIALKELFPPENFMIQTTKDKLGFIAIVISLVMCWLFSIALQAVTIKVQSETPRLGYVYTSYAAGSTMLSILIPLAMFVLWSKTQDRGLRFLIVAPLLVVLIVQWNINWRLNDVMNRSFIPNRRLLIAYSTNASIPERCAALNEWSAGNWPDYYEEGMIDGLQKAQLRYRGALFCPMFIRP